MTQTPAADGFYLKWLGDKLTVTLKLDAPRKGRAALRTNIGHAKTRRREIIAETEAGVTPLAKAWTDIPLPEVEPGVFSAEIPLNQVGIFSGKACFFPEGSSVPEWPEGSNFHVKVESAEIRKNNTIYTVFPRQFGSFREVIRRLPTIMDTMGFRIIQTLPPFPVPTTYAVMGEYGCPFAATDFLSVDPAMAEFDEYSTPLDQFRELIEAVHARGGLMFVDLPANHTGWASTLQTHHPDWFHREKDGMFVCPGAWGVKWADLVELDYTNTELRAYMADVFLFWCRNGIDGFRCDAGYMIPVETWEYIVARVREEYPDTVFMLEGLGGELSKTDRLLAESNLDWAYSEIFQTYNRDQFEWYLPGAIERSEKFGTLVHFAETHDNDRLAKGGTTYAKLRVQLAALLSWQGAWGIANGVEWFAKEKIDVHGKNDLNWGASENMVELIAKLNFILAHEPSYVCAAHLEVVTRGGGNTLAVLRDNLLILANLDCGMSSTIDFDRGKIHEQAGLDLLSETKVDISAPVKLAPGEVKCIKLRPSSTVKDSSLVRPTPPPALYHIEMPRDSKREIVVPENEWVEVKAANPFRLRLIDMKTGKTIRIFRSFENKVMFDAPHYREDGTKCRELRLDVMMYEGGKAAYSSTKFLIPPTAKAMKIKTEMNGDEVRKHGEYRTILSNGAGAASQMRIGWGEIRSQYDAVLAANPNPTCPSDRLNLWTRTRAWLQREGYLREFDKKCVSSFKADPSGRLAKWIFRVPCGMGHETQFEFTQFLVPGKNKAVLNIKRVDSGELDVGDQVRIVFRPDIEWRSFHATTKAFKGLEELFPKAVKKLVDGYEFAPYEDKFTMRVKNGVFHHEAEWVYNVGHAEEAERGQDGSGDLFSPGWISVDLKVGETAEIIGEYKGEAEAGEKVPEESKAKSVKEILTEAMQLYIVKRDDLKTVIAGYPWFLDWGRDTFIFMRGMIAAGMFEDSLKILKAFAAFEENGTLPNIIYGKTAGNRDTTDAQLWFIRCVEELSEKFEKGERFEKFEMLIETCKSIVDNYIKGTPNGIKMDAKTGLIHSPSHFTWMDTNYPACTPRQGYPIEIQALWISALKFLGREELAARALESVKTLFKWEHGYRDVLGEDTIRPNQMFLITLGILKDPEILKASEELLIPGGVRSLNAGHPLYRGVYTGDEDTSRKPAYHNGTVWAWPFPQYAEALVELGLTSKKSALSLLAGAVENLNAGTLTHISENADGDAPHAQKGCTAQAWSVSELLRVWIKLGGR